MGLSASSVVVFIYLFYSIYYLFHAARKTIGITLNHFNTRFGGSCYLRDCIFI